MKMADFVQELDNILSSAGRKILSDAGQISTRQAKEKALAEYRKYTAKTLSEVEKSYLNAINELEKQAKKQKIKDQ